MHLYVLYIWYVFYALIGLGLFWNVLMCISKYCTYSLVCIVYNGLYLYILKVFVCGWHILFVLTGNCLYWYLFVCNVYWHVLHVWDVLVCIWM